MLRVLGAVLPSLRSALRTRTDLALENLALRQQLAALRPGHGEAGIGLFLSTRKTRDPTTLTALPGRHLLQPDLAPPVGFKNCVEHVPGASGFEATQPKSDQTPG